MATRNIILALGSLIAVTSGLVLAYEFWGTRISPKFKAPHLPGYTLIEAGKGITPQGDTIRITTVYKIKPLENH